MSSVGEDGHLHKYACSLSWRGSTADGYEAYSRQHSVVVAPSEIELRLSADPVFRGDAAELNPEQLLLVAASSCQLLEFLALAARSRVAVISYEDRASASMDERARPPKVTEIRLSPSITVASETDATRVERLVEKAHAGCYIANSLKCAMEIDPVIRHETWSANGVRDPGGSLFTLRKGKVVRLVLYTDFEEALEAAGLLE